MVHNKKLRTIVLGIGTKQERIPFMATASVYIYNRARIFITFFNISSFTAHIQRFWNANNEYCCLPKNIYLSEVSTFSFLGPLDSRQDFCLQSFSVNYAIGQPIMRQPNCFELNLDLNHQRLFPNHLFMLTPGNTDWGYTV